MKRFLVAIMLILSLAPSVAFAADVNNDANLSSTEKVNVNNDTNLSLTEKGSEQTPEEIQLEDESRGSILPNTNKSLDECRGLFLEISFDPAAVRAHFKDSNNNRFTPFEIGEFTTSTNDLLACGIKTGDIKLWMLPYFVKFALEFILNIAGLMALAGLVYGGYLYLFSGLTDNKEQGKNAILYSIAGYVLTLTAWALVNIVISLLTTL